MRSELLRSCRVLFNTLLYAKFLAAVFVVSWLLARWNRWRVIFLLGASYYFYARWDWRFLPLIFGSSSVDWLLGHAIAREQQPARRKRWLLLTAVLNLSLLGYFKYANFGIESFRALCAAFGYQPPLGTLEIVLPVGISFFTFESMSYVIDVYRGELEPHESYLEYLTFVAFFPHLVAGPIVRPRDLLPQIARAPRFNPDFAAEGLFLIAIGLVKKVAIGDYLALNLVDRVFGSPLSYSSLECYAAVLGYALQIYCDFSGYTDIAIGSAALLGVRFPKNFDAPYTAHDLVDFWRRWHISLSTWLRDYLYISLGGNRKGPLRTYANLFITMVLGGLWHGANLTFVIWGAWHGAGLALNRFWRNLRERRGLTPGEPSLLARLAGTLVTFHFVCAGWVLFRSNTFTEARLIFRRLLEGTTHHENLDLRVLAALAVGFSSHFLPNGWFSAAKLGFCRLPALAQAALLFGVCVLIRAVASAEAVPFVYFQF